MRHLIAIDDLEQPHVVASFVGLGLSEAQRKAVEMLALEFVVMGGGEVIATADAGATLAMRVGRGPVYVRLGKITTEEISRFVLFAALILTSTGDPKKLTAAGLASLHDRITKLDGRWGERTVADVVIELGAATVEAIAEAVAGQECRHQDVSCSFVADGYCGLALPQVESIVASLEARSVLRRLNAYDPAIYSVAF